MDIFPCKKMYMGKYITSFCIFSHVNLFPTYFFFYMGKTESIYDNNTQRGVIVLRTNRYKKSRSIYYMIS